jgi:hypothetical protein
MKTLNNINTGKSISDNAPQRGSAINDGKGGVVITTNAPEKKVIPQTSKQAQKLLAKKDDKKASEKAVKNVAEKAPKAKKEPKVTLASKLDLIVTKGGKWEALVAKANAASKEMGATTKFNVGTLKGHINFRIKTQKKADFLGALKVTEEGIVAKVAKVRKEKAVA